jgi:hypothetical protein
MSGGHLGTCPGIFKVDEDYMARQESGWAEWTERPYRVLMSWVAPYGLKRWINLSLMLCLPR